jgi:hypothetical protein
MNRSQILLILSIVFSVGCASHIMKYDKAENLKKIDEFDRQVEIIVPEDQEDEQAPPPSSVASEPQKEVSKKKTGSKEKKGKNEKQAKPERRQPRIESNIGFAGRRPIKDPFRVGEKVVHDVSWAKFNAGGMSFEVKPYAQVNGRSSYQFQMRIWSNSFFSSIFSVDDKLVTLVDFETLIPSVFTLHVQHTNELREARWLFDREKRQATYWEKKATQSDGERQKRIQWSVPDYAQNVYSAVYYLRNFTWEVGKENTFYVADDGENLLFKAKAVRKEHITTEIGEFDAIVIKPQIELKGIAKPVGDIFMWLSDDDRKFLLRMESKIKIGTFVTEIVQLNKGRD